MQLEDYFEFEKFDSPFGPFERIRIKGHRIAIDNVLEFYNQGVPAEEIVETHYPSLTLEEVFATLTYYLHNREAVDAYIRRGMRLAEASAFLDLTLPIVRYRVTGIHRGPDGRIVTPNRVIAKVSRIEVA